MKKEQWKDEMLRSLDGAKRAEPSPLLFAKIRAKLVDTAVVGQMQVVRRPYLAVAAACLAVLITANIWALSLQQAETTLPSAAYQVDYANFDLY